MVGASTSHRLLLLGSAEFEPWAVEAEHAALASTDYGRPCVAIVPTAAFADDDGDASFSRWAAKGTAHYARGGIDSDVVPLRTREDADDRDIVRALAGHRMVFFSGGDPTYLARAIRGTRVQETLHDMLADGAVFAGCSAGACLAGIAAPPRLRADTISGEWSDALGLLAETIVAPHWDELDDVVRQAFRAQASKHGARIAPIDCHTAVLFDRGEGRLFARGDVEDEQQAS